MAEQRRKLTVFDRSAIELRLRDGWVSGRSRATWIARRG
jgi:hypothetical protein